MVSRRAMLTLLLLLLLTVSCGAASGFLWQHAADNAGAALLLAAGDGLGLGFEPGGRLSRGERSLVYPDGGVYKLIIGIGVPVPLPNKTLALGVNFQFQYGVPTNASQFARPAVARARSRHDRAAVYEAVETALDRRGLDGRACLLRAVCEAAETPLLHDGLLGELLHLLLTPSLGHAPAPLLAEHRAAEAAGAAGAGCGRRYPACPAGRRLLDRVSRLVPGPGPPPPSQPPPHWGFLLRGRG